MQLCLNLPSLVLIRHAPSVQCSRGAPRRAALLGQNRLISPSVKRRTVKAHGLCRIVCSTAVTSFADAPALPVVNPDGQPTNFPGVSGVYAVYDRAGTLQYVGISRKINITVATHLEALPELVGSVKIFVLPDAGKEELTEQWKTWIQQAGVSAVIHLFHIRFGLLSLAADAK